MHVDLTDEQLRARLADVTRHRDRVQRRLEDAEKVVHDETAGSRARQVEDDLRRWSATVERIDRAEQAAAVSREADERAVEAGIGGIEQLKAERAVAAAAAEVAADKAARAAVGLPEPKQWPQLRAHAQDQLAGADERRSKAKQLDQVRSDGWLDTAELHARLERLERTRAALRHEIDLRAIDSPVPTEWARPEIETPQKQAKKEEHHER